MKCTSRLRRSSLATPRQRSSQLRTAVQGIVPLAGLNLDELGDDLEALSVSKVRQRRTLRVETET